MTDYFLGQQEPWVPISSLQIKFRADQDKALQQNPPNYLTDLPACRKMHCQLCNRLASAQPGDETPRSAAPSRSARFWGTKALIIPPSASPLASTWASSGGGLAEPWLVPT